MTKIIKIICHRGLWKEKSEQNKFVSFRRSVDNDFGMKIVRDNYILKSIKKKTNLTLFN